MLLIVGKEEMSKVDTGRRSFIIKLRMHRRKEMSKLRAKGRLAEAPKERDQIVAKALKVNPFSTEEQFLSSLTEKR